MDSSGEANYARGIWSQLLDNACVGKKVPAKHLLVLGGTRESQTQFVKSLSVAKSTSHRLHERNRIKNPTVANQYALGYTYHDVVDSEQDDVLARLSIHLLADCHDAFVPLAGSLLNPETIPNMAIILLLDWTAPWTWARQVQKMILFLQRVIDLIAEDGAAMLLKKARSRSQDDSSSTRYAPDTEVGNTVSALTSKPGEWGEALDLPLCIICQYAERMLTLEREQNWRDAQFDFVQQYLRAITLKYGGSLIYTASSVKNQLPSMINLLLGIEPVSQRDLVKPNVVDRDKIVVPCNWDSWTKIRILDDGFPAESISGTWSKDMHAATSKSTAIRDVSTSKPSNEAVIIFEATIVDPHMHRSGSEKVQPPGALEVEGQSMQEFLKEQLKKADTPYNTKVKSSSKAQGGTSRRQSLQTIVEKRGRQDLTAEGGNQ